MLRTRKSLSSQGSKSSKTELRTQYSSDSSFDNIGWVGPITLRRRAKPELESERYRDIALRLSVQEVKNLTSKGRYFCEIRLDRTLYARTTSKTADCSVFWGEKFDLNNLPEISIMTIHLFKQAGSTKEKRTRNKCQNQFIAYVTIPLSDLTQSCEMQQWLTMQPPQSAAHGIELVQGCRSFCGEEMKMCPLNTNSPVAARFRKSSVPLPNKRNSSSSFVYTALNGVTDEPFGERKKTSWSIGLGSEPDSSKGTGRTESSKVHSANASVSLPESPLPQIRLSLFYETIDVLPLDCYTELSEFIRNNYLTLIRFLEPRLSAKQKEELASCFVNIHEKHPDFSIPNFIADLLKEDLRQTNDPTMIFRSNSTGSKAVECYIKLVASEYLHELLKSFIDQVLNSQDDFEIDPSRLTLHDNSGSSIVSQLERNRSSLIRYSTAVLRRITSSVSHLPYELRQVFCTLNAILKKSHGAEAAARLISSCLFLRFICPAIHGPVLFGLTTAVPESGRVSRNLTLLAKVLQNLANLAPFEDKELHMKSLNSFIKLEIPIMQAFLHAVSSPSPPANTPQVPSCHNFIDLGYEFAKLTNLLNTHLSGVEIPTELSALSDLLKFIHEHTNDVVLSSWTPGIIASRKLSTASAAASGSMRPNKQNTDNGNQATGLPVLQSLDELNNGYNVTNNIRSKCDYGVYESSHLTNEDHQPPEHQLEQTTDGNPCTQVVPTDKDQTLINPPNEVAGENLDELICQYREQLRQLNACIDRVDPTPSTPRTSISRSHRESLDEESQSSATNPEPTLIERNSSHDIRTDDLCQTNDNDVFDESDYEGDCSEACKENEECNSEPINIRLNNSNASESHSSTRNNFLPESPSLDQLAERLQELKMMVQNERQELEQVMANKTRAIKQQEQSIEQLSSEVDQLRQTPIKSGSNRSRFNSTTISPSSSFSSECYSSAPSDLIHSKPIDEYHEVVLPTNRQCYRVKNSASDHSNAIRCGLSNLLDLTRASEGTGIPLGDLIGPKHPAAMRRRFSESKLINN